MEKTREKFRNRRILIWGYGREGKSTERFLKTCCEPALLEVYEGTRDGVREEDYDYIFVSPGIPFEEDAPLFDNAKFTSQTEVFLEEYGAQTVGITGTKGKSTTCSLLYEALAACSGRKTFLMGNIGKPCFDYLPQMEEESIAVFELSCHQCQRLQAAPHIAVFLNLYEDHLDRYLTMEHYFRAKCGITRGQTGEDILILGQQVPRMETAAQVMRIGTFLQKEENIPPAGERGTERPADTNREKEDGLIREGEERPFPSLRIPGRHNQINAQFVYEIAVCLFGCEPSAVREAMSGFAGLPHRLEHCGTIGGVDWYDDSISTIPEATIQAVSSVPHAKTILIGGMDRGVDYTVLEEFIQAHPEQDYILAYASGERIREELEARGERTADCEDCGGREQEEQEKECRLVHVFHVKDLEAQVRLARRITPAGTAVIMSNAAASYGYFKDFEARGEAFKQYISRP